jgi:hypothetical protein
LKIASFKKINNSNVCFFIFLKTKTMLSNYFFMKNRNGTQVIIKKNGDIHVPILEGEMIEAAPMTLQWPGLLVYDE